MRHARIGAVMTVSPDERLPPRFAGWRLRCATVRLQRFQQVAVKYLDALVVAGRHVSAAFWVSTHRCNSLVISRHCRRVTVA
jgi:hypothetical protein